MRSPSSQPEHVQRRPERDDALDAIISDTVLKRPISTERMWSALVAMWTRIGKDNAIDFMWWVATNESLRGRESDHRRWFGEPRRRDVLRARTFLTKAVPGIRFTRSAL